MNRNYGGVFYFIVEPEVYASLFDKFKLVSRSGRLVPIPR